MSRRLLAVAITALIAATGVSGAAAETWFVLRSLDTNIPMEDRPCWIVQAQPGVNYQGELQSSQPSQAAAQAALAQLQDRGLCKK
jgi:hypothetical protein